MAATLRVLLGSALVLHGLANAVLRMRGIETAAPGVWDTWLTAACALAVVAFVAAGLGVLGVHPLTRVVVWAPLIGSGASLAAHAVLDDPDLWLGVVLSVGLPAVTVWWSSAADTTPVADRPQSGWGAAGQLLGHVFFAWIAVATLFWPWYRTWGVEPREWSMSLPGDEAGRTPALELLHGVTIEAPPSAVWAWLVQLGQDRAGFYSYDRLERLFGAEIHNVFEIRPEWQVRQEGDFVPATQAGYLGGVFGERPGWRVTRVEPERALLLENWGAFVLLPEEGGRTRFLIRSTVSHPQIPAWAAALNLAAFQLPHFIMQRRMMLTIKALAERPPYVAGDFPRPRGVSRAAAAGAPPHHAETGALHPPSRHVTDGA